MAGSAVAAGDLPPTRGPSPSGLSPNAAGVLAHNSGLSLF
jgi:hypothetical protein